MLHILFLTCFAKCSCAATHCTGQPSRLAAVIALCHSSGAEVSRTALQPSDAHPSSCLSKYVGTRDLYFDMLSCALQSKDGPQGAICSFLSGRGQRSDMQSIKQRLSTTPSARLPQACEGIELSFQSAGKPSSDGTA